MELWPGWQVGVHRSPLNPRRILCGTVMEGASRNLRGRKHGVGALWRQSTFSVQPVTDKDKVRLHVWIGCLKQWFLILFLWPPTLPVVDVTCSPRTSVLFHKAGLVKNPDVVHPEMNYFPLLFPCKFTVIKPNVFNDSSLWIEFISNSTGLTLNLEWAPWLGLRACYQASVERHWDLESEVKDQGDI